MNVHKKALSLFPSSFQVDESTTTEDKVDVPDGSKTLKSSSESYAKSTTKSVKTASLPDDGLSSNGINSGSTDQSNEPLKRLFYDAAGAQFNLDAYQLAMILNRSEDAFRRWPLTPDGAKSLVSLVDCDESFRVSWNECEYIVHYVRAWLRTFLSIDSENKGSIHSLSLREAVAGMGECIFLFKIFFKFNNSNVILFWKRF